MELPLAGTAYRTLSIAVPSRLYKDSANPPPLEGLRIAIKDIYDLKGVRTSLGNRAFNELYPPSSSTAETVSYLVSKGANIVGKNHLSSFVMMEHPTQSVEYESPFNPRGDGYQIPGGSSSGGASAVASYDWIDFTLVSDSKPALLTLFSHHIHSRIGTGSVRIPALQNGCFGLRPSVGAISANGVFHVYPGYETVGLMGRDLTKFHDFTAVWLGENATTKTIRSPKIIVPTDFFNNVSTITTAVINSFITDLERSLNTVADRVSIADVWSKSAPVNEKNITTYLYNVRSWSHCPVIFTET